MWPMPPAWATRLWRTATEQFGAAFRVVSRPRAALQAIEQVWHMIVHGAVVIRTPEGEHALLATSVQLDGDILTVIHSDLLQPGREAERDRCMEEHFRSLRSAITPLGEVAKAGHAIQLLLVGAFSTMQGGYWLHFFTRLPSREHWAGDLAWLAAEQLGCWVPMLLRWIAPPLLRWRLRAHFAPLLQDLQNTTHQELDRRMGASRPLGPEGAGVRG